MIEGTTKAISKEKQTPTILRMPKEKFTVILRVMTMDTMKDIQTGKNTVAQPKFRRT